MILTPIRLAFKRWQIWNIFSKILLTLFYLAFLCYFVWVDRFYTPQKSNSKNSTSVSIVNNSTGSIVATTGVASQTTEKTFTAIQLAQFDGTNGQPAYVAVDGVVYDLSAIFRGGIHHGFSAGQDQSAAFHSQHYDSILNGYPVVGKLVQ